MATHYEVLGVPADAGRREVRLAYVALARRHHPDFHEAEAPAAREEAERRMRAVNEAWAVLGDPVQRRAYDQRLGLRGASPGDAPGESFVPFDVSDDAVDPRSVPDTPYRPPPSSPARRAATLAPVTAFAFAIVAFAAAVVVGGSDLLVLAVVLLGVSLVLFLVVPLLALVDASQDEG